MNLKILDSYIILNKHIFIYLFLYIVFSAISKGDSLSASNDTRWKMRQKNITNGPTYTFLKTDKHANIKWGVRHYIPRAPKILKYTENID